MKKRNVVGFLVLLGSLVLLVQAFVFAKDEEQRRWDQAKAGAHLDQREEEWRTFKGADRGRGAGKTSCVSCHTVLPYAIARPLLRGLAKVEEPTVHEIRIIDQIKMRVNHWDEIETPKFGLYYDFDEDKKKQSRGTEGVLNSLILALDDRANGRKEIGAETQKALDHLWENQYQTGENKGSWGWLDFGLDPWESHSAGYYGASLAALAVGTAPGYLESKTHADADTQITLLRGFLRDHYSSQNLFNKLWVLWASTRMDRLLTQAQRDSLVESILDLQQENGGWSLTSLGDFPWKVEEPDGYATGFALHVLMTAGVPKDNPKIAKGLDWLATHQEPDGGWRGFSVNKKRDPKTHVGKFMSDAATAFAVLALSH